VIAERADDVIRRIRSVPPGFVTTYGDVCPEAPRFTGTVLAKDHDPDLPWHRIVRADGSLAKGARQRALLEAEGVPFVGARVDLSRAWFAIDDALPKRVSGPGSAGRAGTGRGRRGTSA
jgi:methylated-DNA-protein-cysteine methyltransferase related protein